MNITSYNITDVSYHYIGLRVLAGLPSSADRKQQTATISRNILKYVNDKALRLMLPESRGTFETTGEKVCQELVHFQFVESLKGAYKLTGTGESALDLLNNRQHRQLRRILIEAHLRTYDNLRIVVQKHLAHQAIWRPIVEKNKVNDPEYLKRLFEPTFGAQAGEWVEQIPSTLINVSPSKLEDVLQEYVLRQMLPDVKISVSMFRSLCDRLASLRLLNLMRASRLDCEFNKSYTPCVSDAPHRKWYTPLAVELNSGIPFHIYLCEPDMTDTETIEKLLVAVYKIIEGLTPKAGYYGLPEVRDGVCDYLRIPEGSFDEGFNRILDLNPCPVTVGLQYDGITGRRKPLVRDRGVAQIYNLVRRL